MSTKSVPDNDGNGPGGPTSIPTGPSEASESLTPDQVFEVLNNVRRRQVVHYLLQQEETVTLRELSRQVAAWENDVAVEQVTSNQRKRVYTSLRQSHLPKLDQYDVVVYDDDRSEVTPTERVSDLRVYMEIVPDEEIPWSVYYTGLGLLSLGCVGAKAVGLFPFSEVPGLGWAALIVLVFLSSGLAHVYQSRQMKVGGEGPPPECTSE